MLRIFAAERFTRWLRELRDDRARRRIVLRIERLRGGAFGDVKSAGEGVAEMRLDYGPGYRLYFAREGDAIVVLLCGGDKSSQRRDIEQARVVLRDWRTGDGRAFQDF